MNPKEEAQNTPEEQREEKAAEYLMKAATNQKKAAKELGNQLESTKETFNQLLESTQGKDYSKVANVINEVNSLLNEAKKGGDISVIVSKIKSLKNAR